MPVPGNNIVKNEGGVRLFKDAPRGIVFDHVGKYIQANYWSLPSKLKEFGVLP